MEKGRLYANKGRKVFVASGTFNCPRINMVSGETLKVRDDYSAGFRASKKLFKAVFH
jgi:hypothetical protein